MCGWCCKERKLPWFFYGNPDAIHVFLSIWHVSTRPWCPDVPSQQLWHGLEMHPVSDGFLRAEETESEPVSDLAIACYRQAQAWQISGDVFNEGYTADRIRIFFDGTWIDWSTSWWSGCIWHHMLLHCRYLTWKSLEPQNFRYFWGLAQPCSTMFNHLSRDDLGRFVWVAQPPISILLGCWQDSCRRFPGNIPISASSHPPFEENNYTSWYTTQNLKHCHFQEKLYIRLKEGPKNHPKHSKTRLCCTMLWCLRHGFLGSAPLSGNLIYYSICPFLSIKYPWTISW